MSVVPDFEIRKLAKAGAIVPFSEGVKRPGLISYGLTSYGYDARLGHKFKVFTNVWGGVIDPKAMPSDAFVEVDCATDSQPHVRRMREDKCANCGLEMSDWHSAPYCWLAPGGVRPLVIPPNSFVLGETLETFTIPRSCLALVVGKSTLARCGLIVNVTPGEPEWVGRWTVEISNTANLPAKVYPGEGIMQVLFLRGEDICQVSYADKAGKYMNQGGLELPKVD